MAYEGWRMSRVELRELLNKYERAVEEDAFGLLRPSKLERQMLGEVVVTKRAEAVKQARDVNRRFIEAVVDDLADLCGGPEDVPSRPTCEFRVLDEKVPTLPASSYGSIASTFLHLFRDWSSQCTHVHSGTYARAIEELGKLVPPGAEVLVPGAGLARLAADIAARGYNVEANEASRLFLTFADYALNRAPAAGSTLYPMAHVFSENFSHEQQYMQISVPTPTPVEIAAQGTAAEAGKPAFSMVPGDFAKLYCKGGAGHRKFDAIVTCFFVDTVTDICELVQVMDGLLAEGGVWINIGPLNWRKEARMKLNWDEVLALWRGLGYEFKTNTKVECDYHMQRGLKMYTESYTCALTAAVKGALPSKV